MMACWRLARGYKAAIQDITTKLGAETAQQKFGESVNRQKRGDSVCYVEREECGLLIPKIDALVAGILKRLSVLAPQSGKLESVRPMVSVYPGDGLARFARHRDNPNRNGRILAFIYYPLQDTFEG